MDKQVEPYVDNNHLHFSNQTESVIRLRSTDELLVVGLSKAITSWHILC